MANPKPNIDNLKPQNKRTKEEQRKIARMGGEASGKARAEKKKLSEFYATALAREYNIQIEPELRNEAGKRIRAAIKKKLKGQELVDFVFGRMFERCDMVTVKLLESIGEFTEGKKYKLGGDADNPSVVTIQVLGVQSKNED